MEINCCYWCDRALCDAHSMLNSFCFSLYQQIDFWAFQISEMGCSIHNSCRAHSIVISKHYNGYNYNKKISYCIDIDCFRKVFHGCISLWGLVGSLFWRVNGVSNQTCMTTLIINNSYSISKQRSLHAFMPTKTFKFTSSM